MKTIKKALQFYFTLLIISIILQSCCDTRIKIVGNGTFEAHHIANIQNDTITKEFYLFAKFEQEAFSSLNQTGIIPNSYATSCPQIYDNTLDESSLKLRCDKNFEYIPKIKKIGKIRIIAL